MKQLFILLIMGLFAQVLPGQNYVPFPIDSAQWNCLNWHQDSPTNIILMNYQYELRGDTIIDGKDYKKMYCTLTEYQEPPLYIGGIREDSVKNIYFFPFDTHLPPLDVTEFPNNTEEHLLYTFDSLYVGMILPINEGNTFIKVTAIDSILIGNIYRKKYCIQNSELLSIDYWIEGIGSTVELFSPYTYEFEWHFFTLCFTDTATYYINAPYGAGSCHFQLSVGVIENPINKTIIYPNPANSFLIVEQQELNTNCKVEIYNSTGEKISTQTINRPKPFLDISNLQSGIYLLKIESSNKIEVLRFLKI